MRKECPLCGAVGKYLKEVEDKGKVLYRIDSYNFMYAKVNICKKCGYSWKE